MDKTVEIASDIYLISLVSDKPGTLELHELSPQNADGMVLVVGCSHPALTRSSKRQHDRPAHPFDRGRLSPVVAFMDIRRWSRRCTTRLMCSTSHSVTARESQLSRRERRHRVIAISSPASTTFAPNAPELELILARGACRYLNRETLRDVHSSMVNHCINQRPNAGDGTPISSPGASVNESGGTIPVPVSRMQPAGKLLLR